MQVDAQNMYFIQRGVLVERKSALKKTVKAGAFKGIVCKIHVGSFPL